MYGEFSIAMLKTLGITLGAFVVMLALAIALLQIQVRRAANNKIYALFLDQKHLFSAMLTVEGDCIYYGKGEKKEKYLLDTSKQFWVTWPPVAASLIGTPVRAHWYVRNRPMPLDPSGRGTNMTSKSLNMIGDEAMLKTTWRDIRDTTGASSRAGAPGGIVIAILIGLIVLGCANLYLIIDLQKVVDATAALIGG